MAGGGGQQERVAGELDEHQGAHRVGEQVDGPLPLDPRRLVVTCEGYRVERDEGLRRTAQELAAAVRQDGVARSTRPLNSYERRVVHVVLANEPGIRTYSVGDEGNRRVGGGRGTGEAGIRLAAGPHR